MTKNNGEKQNNEQTPPDSLPDFKPQYFWAFCSLMLWKLGGFEVISLEHLKQFDYEKEAPQVTWDDKHKAFIMRFKEEKCPAKKISVPGKVRKKMFRKLIKDNFG